MTNKEAIEYLIKPFATSTKSYNEYLKQKEAYDLAIKALEDTSHVSVYEKAYERGYEEGAKDMIDHFKEKFADMLKEAENE